MTITGTTANSGGNITDQGDSPVTARGVCWSSNPNPSILDNITTDGSGTGGFSSTVSGLTAYTTYYIRAYATNDAGTAYGEEISFTTKNKLPVLTTSGVTITGTTATSGGNITDQGDSPVTDRGVCWSTNPNPSILDNITTDGSGTGGFSSTVSGLSAFTTYYIRAYATNDAGTAYGEEISFITTIQIGAKYGGGIVFYIDPSGLHGLISSESDQSSGAEWGCFNTFIGSTSSGIGEGLQNTTAIVNGCATIGIAAEICFNLTLNGYSDWYLPSSSELFQMYVNLYNNLIGGFADAGYFSSTEVNAESAKAINFGTGISYNNAKNLKIYVRAVRAF